VPPIAAPHPQCRLMLERYGCGMLLENWDYDVFLDGLESALHLYGGPEWERMVQGCREAVAQELTWDTQMEKVKPYL
jgi:glycosyltransferase involved in cell wall biosynthesis